MLLLEMHQLSSWVFCIDLLVQVTLCFIFSSQLCFQGSKLFLLADIKGFLTDVKPALLSALDTEYEKNPFEVCCVW